MGLYHDSMTRPARICPTSALYSRRNRPGVEHQRRSAVESIVTESAAGVQTRRGAVRHGVRSCGWSQRPIHSSSAGANKLRGGLKLTRRMKRLVLPGSIWQTNKVVPEHCGSDFSLTLSDGLPPIAPECQTEV